MMSSMGSRRRDVLAASLQRFGLERDRMRAALVRRLGITATDLDALEHLEADGPLTQRELADRLALTSGAVTMLVDRLEAAGWVRRGPHPSDRRYVLLALTGEALAGAPDALDAYHSAIVALVAGVGSRDSEVVARFLQAAAAAAGEAADRLAHPD
jgi:DNA-binding MarR family transcriptional regulator